MKIIVILQLWVYRFNYNSNHRETILIIWIKIFNWLTYPSINCPCLRCARSIDFSTLCSGWKKKLWFSHDLLLRLCRCESSKIVCSMHQLSWSHAIVVACSISFLVILWMYIVMLIPIFNFTLSDWVQEKNSSIEWKWTSTIASYFKSRQDWRLLACNNLVSSSTNSYLY